jgi:DNA-binding PadR family transcriptional regulator
MSPVPPKASKPVKPIDRETGPDELFELFFPIHYLLGFEMEDRLRAGKLTRLQAIVLYLVRHRGEGGTSMRRKDIERTITDWYEVTSSALSRSLRVLCRPPLSLAVLEEDPASGREKIFRLTPEGERVVGEMMVAGRNYTKWIADHLSDEELRWGIHFLARVSELYEPWAEAAEPDAE